MANTKNKKIKKDKEEIAVQKLLDALPLRVRMTHAHREDTLQTEDGLPKRVVLILSVSKPGVGFGEILFITNKEGQLFIDAEGSSREDVKAMLGLLVDGAIMDTDTDPAKHLAFNLTREMSGAKRMRNIMEHVIRHDGRFNLNQLLKETVKEYIEFYTEPRE